MSENMTQIAKACVQIVPTTKDFGKNLMSQVGGETESAGSSAGSKFSSGFKGAMGAVGKAAIAAVSAAAVACAKVVGDAVSAYGDYEQLVGGAKLMFGDAYDYIADKAANAFSTVQMSANDYLTQVNGFAVGLKTALGGNEQAAAELADKIITAEADIVAATGNTQEAVQNAFNGIMKSNYTMLDNLGLGITPTKEGFQEVIDKVNEYNASLGNATNYTIENLADCESALVEYIDMVEMSGYAHDEAAGTIQGSLASMKGAWENLLVGMAGGEDLSTLMDNLTSTVVSFAQNIQPVILNALNGLGSFLAQMVPVITSALPTIIQEIIPSLTAAATQIVTELGSAILENVPLLLQTAFDLNTQLMEYIIQGAPQMIQAAVQLILELAQGIVNYLPTLIESAGNMIEALGTGLIESLPTLIDNIPIIIDGIIQALVSCAPKLMEVGFNLFVALVKNLPQILISLNAAVVKMMASIISGLVTYLGKMALTGLKIGKSALEGLSNAWANAGEIGTNLVKGLWNGIKSVKDWILDKIKGFGDSVLNSLKSFFGIHSPSRVMQDVIGKNLALGIGVGIEANTSSVTDAMDSLGKEVTASAISIDAVASSGSYSVNGEVASSGSGLAEIKDMLRHYLPQIGNQQIVMDTGALVGATASKMDDALGRMAVKNARGVVYA